MALFDRRLKMSVGLTAAEAIAEMMFSNQSVDKMENRTAEVLLPLFLLQAQMRVTQVSAPILPRRAPIEK